MSYKKMNPEVKQVWVNALRSGEYAQADGALRNGDAFCCLGVLCDLSGADEWNGEFYCGQAAYLPDDVGTWAGLSYRPQVELAKLNDNEETFSEIADWIEAHL